MKKYTYTARNGNKQYKPALSWLLAATETSEGFCLACGAEHGCVEPDARKYHCTDCGAHKVYGAEELMLMNLYYSDQGEPDNRTSHDYGDPSTQVSP
jgi:hypothetical protein